MFDFLSKSRLIIFSLTFCTFIAVGKCAEKRKVEINIPVQFGTDSEVAAVEQSTTLFDLDYSLLSQGSVQIKGEINIRSDFENVSGGQSDFAKWSNLDNKFAQILNGSQKDSQKASSNVSQYDNVFVSKQAYILSNVDASMVGKQCILDERYRQLAFSKAQYQFPEEFGKKRGEVDFDWIITQSLPLISGVRSKTECTVYNLKQELQHDLQHEGAVLSAQQAAAILAMDRVIGRLPDKIMVSSMYKSGTPGSTSDNFGIGGEHSYFKSSLSITCYYEVNSGNDLLVVTYQIAGLKKPMILPSSVFKEAASLFSGGVSATVKGIRKYFN
ncbi:MAG: hypothetical protein HQK53_03825 [Oligoflexia bacterium]|nr:hypothetical protein [Oligoflexia bacterium]